MEENIGRFILLFLALYLIFFGIDVIVFKELEFSGRLGSASFFIKGGPALIVGGGILTIGVGLMWITYREFRNKE